jgi:hypothetical protein
MMSIRVMPPRTTNSQLLSDPEADEDVLQVMFDPYNPASVERARAVLAEMLGMDQGPILFWNGQPASLWNRLSSHFLKRTPGSARSPGNKTQDLHDASCW